MACAENKALETVYLLSYHSSYNNNTHFVTTLAQNTIVYNLKFQIQTFAGDRLFFSCDLRCKTPPSGRITACGFTKAESQNGLLGPVIVPLLQFTRDQDQPAPRIPRTFTAR